MQVTFNAKERTLREIVALALSAGWKVTKVTRAPGSLFGHIVAVPVDVPPARVAGDGGEGEGQLACEGGDVDVDVDVGTEAEVGDGVCAAEDGVPPVAAPRIESPTFACCGSTVDLSGFMADSTSSMTSTDTSVQGPPRADRGAGSGPGAGVGIGIGAGAAGEDSKYPASSPFSSYDPAVADAQRVEVVSRGHAQRVSWGRNYYGGGGGGGGGGVESAGYANGGAEQQLRVLKKKPSLGEIHIPLHPLPSSCVFDNPEANEFSLFFLFFPAAFLNALSFPRSSSLDYCFSHRS